MVVFVKFLGILLLSISLIWPTYLFIKNKRYSRFLCVIGVLVGFILIIHDRVIEIPLWKLGNIKAVAEKAVFEGSEIGKIKQRVENQSATIDSVARKAYDVADKLKLLENLQSSLEENYKKSVIEIEKMRTRNEIISLADKAIVRGDRLAYNDLVELVSVSTNEMSEMAIAELLRVKSFYISGTRVKAISIEGKGRLGSKLKEEEIPTHILISDLKNHVDWRIRTKAAKLLGDRREKIVPEALLEAVNNDLMLDVVRQSIVSFGSITGFDNPDVFSLSPANEWWKINKEQVEKNLK